MLSASNQRLLDETVDSFVDAMTEKFPRHSFEITVVVVIIIIMMIIIIIIIIANLILFG